MSKKVVVFDLDGTLVYTLPDIASAFNRVLESHGHPTHQTADYANLVGWGLAATLKNALGEVVSEPLFNRMLERVLVLYENDPARESSVYPGMDVLVRELKFRNVRTGVFTNKSEPIAVKVVESLLPEVSLDFVIGSNDGVPLKPDPTALQNCIDIHQVGVSSILMVGDSPVDVETARRAGVDFVGVTWGYRDAGVLRAAGAEKIFHRPDDLHRWFVDEWGNV